MNFPVRLHARASLCSDFHVMVLVKRNHHALLKLFNGKPNYRGLYCYWKLKFANESSAFIFDILMKNNYMNHAWAMMSIIEESRTPGIAELCVLGLTVILKCAKFFRSLTTPLLPFYATKSVHMMVDSCTTSRSFDFYSLMVSRK